MLFGHQESPGFWPRPYPKFCCFGSTARDRVPLPPAAPPLLAQGGAYLVGARQPARSCPLGPVALSSGALAHQVQIYHGRPRRGDPIREIASLLHFCSREGIDRTGPAGFVLHVGMLAVLYLFLGGASHTLAIEAPRARSDEDKLELRTARSQRRLDPPGALLTQASEGPSTAGHWTWAGGVAPVRRTRNPRSLFLAAGWGLRPGWKTGHVFLVATQAGTVLYSVPQGNGCCTPGALHCASSSWSAHELV